MYRGLLVPHDRKYLCFLVSSNVFLGSHADFCIEISRWLISLEKAVSFYYRARILNRSMIESNSRANFEVLNFQEFTSLNVAVAVKKRPVLIGSE